MNSKITYNVTEGVNTIYGYKKLSIQRFYKRSFAIKHLISLGVKPVKVDSKYRYFALTLQEGCAHQNIQFYQ